MNTMKLKSIPAKRNILVHLMRSGVKMKNLALEKLIISQLNSFFVGILFLSSFEGRHGPACHAASKKYKYLDKYTLKNTNFKQKATVEKL